MSWHKENQDLSEWTPRKQPPGPSGHTVARVQPLIPDELSFHQNSRKPLSTLNTAHDSFLSKTIPAKLPPQPQQPPLKDDFRAPSELSKRFSEMSFKNKSNFEREKAMLDSSEDLIKYLVKQMMKLEDEVKQQNNKITRLEKDVSQLQHRTQTSMSKNDASTQMSAPSSPDRSLLRRQSHDKYNSSLPKFDQTCSSLPRGASAGNFFSPQQPTKIPPQAPLIEEEDSSDDSDDDIPVGDVHPIEDIFALKGFSPVKEKPEENSFIDNNSPELYRMKDMGVSFITREDLYPRKTENAWYPQATDPFRNEGPHGGKKCHFYAKKMNIF